MVVNDARQGQENTKHDQQQTVAVLMSTSKKVDL